MDYKCTATRKLTGLDMDRPGSHVTGPALGARMKFLRTTADLPMFGIEITPDLRTGFWTDHATNSLSWRITWIGVDESQYAATDPATGLAIARRWQRAGHIGLVTWT